VGKLESSTHSVVGALRPNHGVARHREREKYRKKQSMRDIKKEVVKFM
jgi:hypothetical protein